MKEDGIKVDAELVNAPASDEAPPVSPSHVGGGVADTVGGAITSSALQVEAIARNGAEAVHHYLHVESIATAVTATTS